MAVSSPQARDAPLGELAATAAGHRGRRSPLWVEALVIVWLSWLYDEISNLSSLRLHTALMHAGSVLHVEQVWHLEPERALNVWAAAHPALALPLADFYDTSHFAVTSVILTTAGCGGGIPICTGLC